MIRQFFRIRSLFDGFVMITKKKKEVQINKGKARAIWDNASVILASFWRHIRSVV